MSRIRKFHISDLPQEKVYVYLDAEFRKMFFQKLYETIGGSTTLSRIIKLVKDEEIRRWKTGERAIPIFGLLTLNNLLKNKFPTIAIEKNIVAYKSPRTRRITKSPIFPIVEDCRLVRIVTHLISDGYDGGRSHPPSYANTEPRLIEVFENDLELFGDVPIKKRIWKYKNSNWKDLHIIEFPRVFTFILRHIYQMEFRSRNARLPETFFSLPKELKYEVIKAFADDESHVRESSITFISSSELLLSDIKRLIAESLNTNDITEIRYGITARAYNFSIRRSTLEAYSKYINFNHPSKKNRLEFILSRKSTPGNKYKEGEAKSKILGILSENPSSAIELALKLGIKPKNIRYHLSDLTKDGKVIKVNNISKTIIWGTSHA